MSTDVIEFPATDDDHPIAALKDRRRREPRDAAPGSTNPNSHEDHAEAQARSAAEPTAPEVRASNAPPDAPATERNGEGDATTLPPRSPGRNPKGRAKSNGNGGSNGSTTGHGHEQTSVDAVHAQLAAAAAENTPRTSRDDLLLKRLAPFVAAMCLFLSLVVLGISMPHLASGVSKITACEFYTAIFMAVVFDLSQVGAEIAALAMPLVGITSRRHHLVCAFIIGACTLVSMTLNVRAFLEHVTTPYETWMAVAWGGLLPVLVLLLVFVASSFVMHLHSKPVSPTPRSG